MGSFAEDPINNAIQNGIKEDITVAMQHRRWRAAIILIYAGMDAMAYLDLPANQTDVTRADFIRWTDHYIRLPGQNQIAGTDFYGARCAMLHAYGAVSRMSREGKCRMIGYMDNSIPAVRYDPTVSTDLVLVSIVALKTAFFSAIDDFLVTAFTDKAKAAIVEQRLLNLTAIFHNPGAT